MNNLKHDYRVILNNEDGTLNTEWGFMGITARKLQVEIGKLLNTGELPKEAFKHWYKTGRIIIEKDGVVSSIGA